MAYVYVKVMFLEHSSYNYMGRCLCKYLEFCDFIFHVDGFSAGVRTYQHVLRQHV